MKFSIIIPVYNVERWLDICLDSVLAQTCTDWECICVDDGSRDASGEILDEYGQRDGRFRIIHQINAGVSRARNQGLSIASGDWIVFCDSDDYMPSDLLENFSKRLDEDGELDGVVFRPEQVDEKGVSISRQCNHLVYAKFTSRIVSQVQCMPDMWCAIGGPWAKVYRRRLVEKYQIRFLDPFSVAEDALFNAEYYACCRSLLVDYRVTGHFYRVFDGGLSRTCTWEKTLEQIRIVQGAFDFSLRTGLKESLVFAVRKSMLLLRHAFRLGGNGRMYAHRLVYDPRFKRIMLPVMVQHGPWWVKMPALMMMVMPRWMIFVIIRLLQKVKC